MFRSASKKAVLDDDLARELYAEETRLMREQHKSQFARIDGWATEKQNYLAVREVVTTPVKLTENDRTIADAQFHLSVFEAFEKEMASLGDKSVPSLKSLGDAIRKRNYATELSTYVYEDIEGVNEAEAVIDAHWSAMKAAAAEKIPILKDHLERETLRERTRLSVATHKDVYDQLVVWIEAKRQYLNAREDIGIKSLTHKDDLQTALYQLGNLEVYNGDKIDMHAGTVTRHRQLGAEIRAATHSSMHSSWSFENPEEIVALEVSIEECWEELSQLSVNKQAYLDDALAREQAKEANRLLVANYRNAYMMIDAWCREQLEYLAIKEPIDLGAGAPGNVVGAKQALNDLTTFEKAKSGMADSAVTSLQKLGDEIRTSKYETTHPDGTSWSYEFPEDRSKEDAVAVLWDEMAAASKDKLATLEDDLLREEFKSKVLLWVQSHTKTFNTIKSWYESSAEYLAVKESITNSEAAKLQLNRLTAFRNRKSDVTSGDKFVLTQLGSDIRAAAYSTDHSAWVYHDMAAVLNLESSVEKWWKELDAAATTKEEVLDDDLTRELYAEATRRLVTQHADKHRVIQAWAAQSATVYLNTRETVETTTAAAYNRAVFEAYCHICLLPCAIVIECRPKIIPWFVSRYTTEFEAMTAAAVKSAADCAAVIHARKHASAHSSYVYESPEAIDKLEDALKQKWIELEALAAAKKPVVEVGCDARDNNKQHPCARISVIFVVVALRSHFRLSACILTCAMLFQFGLHRYVEVLQSTDAFFRTHADNPSVFT